MRHADMNHEDASRTCVADTVDLSEVWYWSPLPVPLIVYPLYTHFTHFTHFTQWHRHNHIHTVSEISLLLPLLQY